jgi:hypothetical protein
LGVFCLLTSVLFIIVIIVLIQDQLILVLFVGRVYPLSFRPS